MTHPFVQLNRFVPATVLLLSAAVLLTSAPARAQEETPPVHGQGLMWLVSPLVGYNRDELKQPDRTGQIQTRTETAPEYGLFALVAHPRFVLNDFLFFTEAAGDTDVMGNFFYANLYGDPDATVTWNVGAGHLYHKIQPQDVDIEVSVPLLKAGPVLRYKPWGLTFNPYIGYSWERVDTHVHVPPRDQKIHSKNDAPLYGLTVDWRWRMVGLNVKYYYQDSQEGKKGLNTLLSRFVVAFNQHWGAEMRLDYMEHLTTDDTSLMFGPVYVF